MLHYKQIRYRRPAENNATSRYDERRYGSKALLYDSKPAPSTPLNSAKTKQAAVSSLKLSQSRSQKKLPIIQDIARPTAASLPQHTVATAQSAKARPKQSQVLQRSLVDKPSQIQPERPFQQVRHKRRPTRFVLPRIGWRMAAGALSIFAVFGFIGAGAAFLMNGAM